MRLSSKTCGRLLLANQAKRQQERDCVVFSKLIAIYLFLGGTAAGAFALTALFDVAKAVKDHRRGEYGRAFLAPQSVISEPTYKRIRRFVYGTALIVVLTGELCLVADLGRPESFFFLFLYPTSSLVSIGAYALTLLTVFLAISLTDTIFVLPKWARVVSFAAKAIGLPIAVIVMVYTGLLLQSVISVEIWQSAWLPVLFAASALSCGCAVVMLAACTCEDVRVTRIMARLLAWIDIAFILIEIVSIVALLAFGKGSASMAVMRLFEGDLSTTFWAGFVACGLAIPLAAEAVSLARKREIPTPGAAGIATLALVGGLCLRIAIVACGVAPSP